MRRYLTYVQGVKRTPLPEVLTPAAYLAWLDSYSRLFTSAYRAQWRHEPCVYCGLFPATRHEQKLTLTRDHIMPQSVGGDDSWQNLATACAKCNHKRGTMPVLWYLVLRELVVYCPLTKRERHLMGFRASPMPRLDDGRAPAVAL